MLIVNHRNPFQHSNQNWNRMWSWTKCFIRRFTTCLDPTLSKPQSIGSEMISNSYLSHLLIFLSNMARIIIFIVILASVQLLGHVYSNFYSILIDSINIFLAQNEKKNQPKIMIQIFVIFNYHKAIRNTDRNNEGADGQWYKRRKNNK